jgi:hypothetical protein
MLGAAVAVVAVLQRRDLPYGDFPKLQGQLGLLNCKPHEMLLLWRPLCLLPCRQLCTML